MCACIQPSVSTSPCHLYICPSILQCNVDPFHAVRYCVQKRGKTSFAVTRSEKIWQWLGEQTGFPNVKEILSPASVSSHVYSIETNWVSLDMRVSLKSLYRALNNCEDRYFLFILNQMNILISQEAIIPTTRSVSEPNNVIGPWKSAALVMVKDSLRWVPQLWPCFGTFIRFIDNFIHDNLYCIPLKKGGIEIRAVSAPPGGRFQYRNGIFIFMFYLLSPWQLLGIKTRHPFHVFEGMCQEARTNLSLKSTPHFLLSTPIQQRSGVMNGNLNVNWGKWISNSSITQASF